MVPNPLQLEHAPDGELNEKLCGSRSSYDKSHFAQYLLSLNNNSCLSVLTFNSPSPILRANSTDSVILCLDFLFTFSLSIKTCMVCFLFLLKENLSCKFFISPLIHYPRKTLLTNYF